MYKKIYNGIKNFDKEIEIDKKWSTSQIHDLYIRILMDTPLFFFVNQNKLSIKKTLKKEKNVKSCLTGECSHSDRFFLIQLNVPCPLFQRSEERRVGKEC